MRTCLFATDLHGSSERYKKLFRSIVQDRPAVVCLGGDLLPSPWIQDSGENFIQEVLADGFRDLRRTLGEEYPHVLMILGNDDGKLEEQSLVEDEFSGIWHYIHGRSYTFEEYTFYGYSYVPPTPFQLKDWEKYDVGRYVPPGCVSPEEGLRTVAVQDHEVRYGNIAADLQELVGERPLDRAVFLFHGPPHETNLDRAALDDKMIDHVPLDVHVGSVAVRRFIDRKQPYVTLHGHVHESARLTGSWQQQLGRTHVFGAAHDGPELALVRFDLDHPERAERQLL